MSLSSHFSIHQIAPNDIALMEAMLATFDEAFGEGETYSENRPGAAYLERLLGRDYFIALVALQDSEVVGGIAAYELIKFEQERSEIYIYDLAVAATHRRQGIATALIQKLKKIAEVRGAYVVYVQADIDVVLQKLTEDRKLLGKEFPVLSKFLQHNRKMCHNHQLPAVSR